MKITKRQIDSLVKKVYGDKFEIRKVQIDLCDKITRGRYKFLLVEIQPNFVAYIQDKFFANSNVDLYNLIREAQYA